ncbi:MBL fold metallo-hydrolase [Microbacterium immunditiarum]|uniref:Cyclase n=1 Tax=Microbacterium immunditiarum TaxID=337480 RepID=A0A7Y9GM37_9MICO|nr:MBL fold metallo-hydrolase [Microbacterium immunditiarum]NYE18991.1 cyclase [Microbacterium immunditiarum]
MASESGQSELVDVADGVLAWVQTDGTWWLNNAGALHHDGAVLVVDTCASERRTRAFLDAVAGATDGASPRWAVNTHHHGDHAYGNALLPASTVLVGHTRMRDGLREDFIFDACPPYWSPTPQWGAIDAIRLPDLTIDEDCTIFLGDLAVEVRHPGFAAHTDGDVVVFIPDRHTLFAGDLLFNGLTPMLLMGSLDGARRSLEWISSLGAEHVVPGHGPVIGAAELDRVLDDHDRYFRFIATTAAENWANGCTPLEAAQRCQLGEFAALPDSERLVLNLHKAYADLQGSAVDLRAAMADAVLFNGGPLHTSL